MRLLQKTERISGVGIHSGQVTTLQIFPAKEKGIWFSKHLPATSTRASYSNVSNTKFQTNLGDFATVEHLMAALWSNNVNNVVCCIDGEKSSEVPIMDGSALPFIELLEKSKLIAQNNSVEFLVIKNPVHVTGDYGSFSRLEPLQSRNAYFEVDIKVDFFGLIERFIYTHNWLSFESQKSFKQEIAPARTFVFEREVDHLKKTWPWSRRQFHQLLYIFK